jgi:hypothetical protein
VNFVESLYDPFFWAVEEVVKLWVVGVSVETTLECEMSGCFYSRVKEGGF